MDDMTQKIPDNLLEFATSQLRTVEKVEIRGWKHQETGVWQLETKQGRVFLKSHRQKAKFEQELQAYLEFVLLSCITKIVWSLELGEQEYAELAREMLEALTSQQA
jgi:hypothetical protein